MIPLAVSQESSGRRNGFTQIALVSRVGEAGLNFVASEEPTPFAATRPIDAVQGLAAAGGGMLLLVAIGLAATRAPPQEQRGAAIAGAIGAIAIGVPILLAVFGLDFVNPRNLIAALVPLSILLAIGFGSPGAGRLGEGAALVACVLFAGVLVVVNASAQMQRPDWRGAAAALESSGRGRVFVVPRNGDDPLDYYLGAHKADPGSTRIRTSEIDVLSTNYGVKAPAGPFKRVDVEGRAPIFILWRYRASHPTTVRLRDLAGRPVLSERSAVLVRGG